MNLIINDLAGLERAATLDIGGRKFTVKTMNVLTSRKGWVKLQPMLTGIMTADDLLKEGIAIGGLAMVGITGRLDPETFDWLSNQFAELTAVDWENADGTPCRFEKLSQAGAMDTIFAGRFDEMMTWLDACIHFIFGTQLGKQFGALEARAKLLQKKLAADVPEKSASPSQLA